MPYYLSGKPMNPLARALAAIGGVLLAVGAFFIGLAALAVVLGLAVIGWVAASIWLWWARRKAAPGARARPAPEAESLETEYIVVSRRRD